MCEDSKCFAYGVRPSHGLPSQLRQLITRSARACRSSAHNLNVRGYGPTLIRMSDGDADARDHRL